MKKDNHNELKYVEWGDSSTAAKLLKYCAIVLCCSTEIGCPPCIYRMPP